MSLPQLLVEYFPALVRYPTYPWDSVLCSSTASATVVKNTVTLLTDGAASHDCSHHYHGRIDVIPLPVDTDVYTPGDKAHSRTLLGLSKSEFIILYVGQIAATKADLVPFLEPLRALASTKGNPELRLILAGGVDPQYLRFFKKECEGLGLSKSVTIYENVSRLQKLALYRSADVFFSPSDTTQESFGLTLIEAMACGLPQVVSDWNGYRDIVINGVTGFLVKTIWATECDYELAGSGEVLGQAYDQLTLGQSVVVDIAQWKDNIQWLISSPSLLNTMATNSRKRAIDTYGISAIARMHIALWSELWAIRDHGWYAERVDRRLCGHPRYLDRFGHYCTELLEGHARVRVASRRAQLTQHELSAKIFKEGIIEADLAMAIYTQCSGGEGTQVNELVGSRLLTASADRVIRHVLWLVKYGLLELF